MFNTTTVPTHQTCAHKHTQGPVGPASSLNSPIHPSQKREGGRRKSEAGRGGKKLLNVEVEDK